MPYVSLELINRIKINKDSSCEKIMMPYSNPINTVYLKYRDRIEYINPVRPTS
jgi:hypothetical protein